MANRISVLMMTNRLNLGGIEKTAIAFARRFDSRRFEVHFCAYRELGPREQELKTLGIPYFCAEGNPQAVREYIDHHGIQALHSHEQGEGDTAEILRALEGSGLTCRLQSNVFSLRSPKDDRFDRQLFISKTNLIKYEMVYELPADFSRRAVLYNPIDLTLLDSYRLDARERTKTRAALGIAPDDFVIGKLARKTLGKWSDLNLDILPPLLKAIPNLKFLVLGLPDSRRRLARRMGVEQAIVAVDETLDLSLLTSYYQSMDAYVHFSKIGECCSAAIQEAAAFGLPVITNSTPFSKKHFRYRDNGQIEQVEHGVTGYISSTPEGVTAAVLHLWRNPEERTSMGAAGRRFAENSYSLPAITRQLELHTLQILAGNGLAEADRQLNAYQDTAPYPSAEEISRYAQEYPALSRQDYAEPSLSGQIRQTFRKRVRDRKRALVDLVAIRRGKEQ